MFRMPVYGNTIQKSETLIIANYYIFLCLVPILLLLNKYLAKFQKNLKTFVTLLITTEI